MKCLEFETDLLTMRGISDVEHLPNRTIQRTPSEPNFWFGNRVIFKDPPRDAQALIAQFQADFPQAGHICISWDIPNLPLQDVDKVFADTGMMTESADTLVLQGEIARNSPPTGVTMRLFSSEQDWQQSIDQQYIDHEADGTPTDGLRAYLSARARARKRQIAAGQCQWFGAFAGDKLVGDMGVVFDRNLIRFQSVQTHSDHRRQGICAALLTFSMDWAKKHSPQARAVIVANSDSPAGRVYRRAGFALHETTISLYQAV